MNLLNITIFLIPNLSNAATAALAAHQAHNTYQCVMFLIFSHSFSFRGLIIPNISVLKPNNFQFIFDIVFTAHTNFAESSSCHSSFSFSNTSILYGIVTLAHKILSFSSI